MTHGHAKLAVVFIGTVMLGMGAVGCAQSDTATTTLNLALYPDADYFTLRIEASGRSIYDTGCLEKRASTFRVSKLKATDDATVFFHYYAAVGCNDVDSIGVGFRGGVSIVPGEERYYHVPILADGGVTALPVELNVSAGFAVEVSYCESDAECVGEVEMGGGCYKVFDDPTQKYLYWCVPTCEVDDDCAEMHGSAICDSETKWCTIPSPFPLNMSGPRAFGHAATMPDGDVLLVGGFSSLDEGVLSASGVPLERYNAATGLFEMVSWEGDVAANVALSGVASMGSGVLALVGGASGAKIGGKGLQSYTGAVGDIVVLEPTGGTCGEGGGSGCVETGSVTVHQDAMQGAVVSPGLLVAADGLVVIGGLRPDESGDLAPSAAVTLCAMDDDDTYVCTQVASLSEARVAPALACLTDTCDKIMVLGGHEGTKSVEVFDWNRSGESPVVQTPDIDGLDVALHYPVLCSGRVVGGADGDGEGVSPIALTVDPDAEVITATVLENLDAVKTTLHPAVYGPVDGDCWVLGGQSGTEASRQVRRITASVVAAATPGLNLERGRYGASLAVVNSGPLAGSVMVAGGLTFVDLEAAAEGAPRDRLVHGAEMFRP